MHFPTRALDDTIGRPLHRGASYINGDAFNPHIRRGSFQRRFVKIFLGL